MKKLPQEFLREITRQNGGDHWDIRTICRAIKTELAVYEMTDFNNVGYSEGNITSSFITKASTERRPGNLDQKRGVQLDEKLCIFCNENHNQVKCNLDHNKKLEKIKMDKLCFNCLGKHRVADCKSKKLCKRCNRRHHTSICTEQENTVKLPVHLEKTSVSTSPSDSNVVSLHSTSSRSSKVLLKTAVAEVQSTNGTECQANIMFDEGSQRSFISEKLAAELQLEVTGREVLNVAGFGSKKTEVRHLDKVHLTIIGEGNQYLPIELLVVPQIGVPIQTHSREIKHLPHLRHLKLAHPNPSDQPFNIEILIGADYYWDFILGHVVRGKGPTAVKSKLGYLLSGPIHETNKKKNTAKTGSQDEKLRNLAFCRPTSSQQKPRKKRARSKEDLKKQKNKDKPVTSLDPFNQMNTEKSKELSGELKKVHIPVVSLMNIAEPFRVNSPKVYRDHQTSSLKYFCTLCSVKDANNIFIVRIKNRIKKSAV
jgi:hypothetical protein